MSKAADSKLYVTFEGSLDSKGVELPTCSVGVKPALDRQYLKKKNSVQHLIIWSLYIQCPYKEILTGWMDGLRTTA